jgi:hypothetical protein
MESQTVEAFIVDLESYLKLHDVYWREIRSAEAEINLLDKAVLPQYEEQKNQIIQEKRAGQLQADEYYRATRGFLLNLSGLENLEQVRDLLLNLKIAFSRKNEARANLADAQFTFSVAQDTGDDRLEQISAMVVIAQKELAAVEEKLASMVPTSFSPVKSNLLTVN